MKHLANFIGYQLVWFAAVAGAAHGMAWAGPMALLAFAGWQLNPVRRVRGDIALMGVAALLGLVIDSTMGLTGAIRYLAPWPAPASGLSPAWILSLWGGFALTLNHSLNYIVRRPAIATVLGVFVGPLSYYLAGRAWHVVEFSEPRMVSLAALGACWGVAMFVMALAVGRCARRPVPPALPASGVQP